MRIFETDRITQILYENAMDALLKQEIHELIENCDDDILLNEAKAIFASKKHIDWWYELTSEQQNEVAQLVNEPDDTNIVSESDYLNMTARWRMK
jgi:hypothetical protein